MLKIPTDRTEQCILWTGGALVELSKLGFCDTNLTADPKGLAMWDQLDAEGKAPSNSELVQCMVAMEIDKGLSFLDSGLILITLMEFRDNRERMKEFVEKLPEG